MINYDWGILRLNSIPQIITVLDALTSKDYSSYSKRTNSIISSFTDVSAFLVSPEGLVMEYRKYSDAEVYYYLEMAALRSYINYKLYNESSLNLDVLVLDYEVCKLQTNRLLTITNNKLYLKYEEN